MFRLLLALSTIGFIAGSSQVQAQGFGWFKNRGVRNSHANQAYSHQNRHHTQGRQRGYRSTGSQRDFGAYAGGPTLFGFSFGPGPGSPPGYTAGYPDPYFLDNYGLDPWARGSFRAPDLLDDPYFYDRVPAQHRRTPGRYSHQRVPQERYRSMRPAVRHQAKPMIVATPQASSPVVQSLRAEGNRLHKSFVSHKRGDQWNAYLAPHQLAELADTGNITDLKMLLQRFDGAIEDQELNSVVGVEGFVETRNLLSQYLSEVAISSTSSPMPVETPARSLAPEVSPLPAPQPELLPTPSSLDSLESLEV